MTRTPGLLLAAAFITLLLAPTTPTADGDPLELYDFSGNADLNGFLERIESRCYRHGLWTIQQVCHKKPFGDGWTTDDNATTHINVYYGTRPVWRSGAWPSAGASFPETRSEGVWKDAKGEPTQASLGDFTSSGGLTVAFWGHRGKADAVFKILKLVRDGPLKSRVEVLWRGFGYDELRDLDWDGKAEIVALDLTHDYAPYMGFHSYWPRVVFRWDMNSCRYVCAQRRFESTAWIDGDGDGDKQSNEELVDARVAEYRKKLKDRAEHPYLELSLAVIDLLYTGRVENAVSLVRESDLTDYVSHPGVSETRVSKKQWWKSLVEGCQSSPYWNGLCDEYPDLKRLDADLSKCG